MLHDHQIHLRRFMVPLIYVIAGIIVFDFLIGNGLSILYAKQKSGLLYRTTYAIDSTRAEYIILGSSRANHNYDPKVFEKVFHSSVYNCGRDKQGLLYSCAILSAILDRYQPKCIIIDIRPDEFTQSDEGTLATLLPYHQNKAVTPYLKYNSKFEDIKLWSQIYPYNSLLTNLMVGLKANWREDYKGYRKLTNFNSEGPIELLKEGTKIDSTKIAAFRKLLARVKSLNIPVFLVISPIHYDYQSRYTSKVCTDLQRSFTNCRYLDFTNSSMSRNNKLFSDNNHLNNSGADEFSKVLGDKIAASLILK